MRQGEHSTGDWAVVGLAMLALMAGWPMALLIVWFGPSLWDSSALRPFAVPGFGIVAPVVMTISAVWALLIRDRDWDGARRRFVFSIAVSAVIALGYAFLIRWIELP